MSEEQADAAMLRLTFEQISEEWASVFAGRNGKLPANWRPTPEDEAIRRLWAKLYDAVRDASSGLVMLAHVQSQQEMIELLEAQIARLEALREASEFIPIVSSDLWSV